MKHFIPASVRFLLLEGILFSFLSGCSILDPAEQIPSYIHIDAMKLSASGNQGSSSSKITDAWIYMDGQLIGAFQLPCTVPILADGTHSFVIKGGIKMNGLSATRAIYPFWKAWEGSVALVRSKVTQLGTPTVVYFPGTDFVWLEDFESPGLSLVRDPQSSATISPSLTADAYEGNHSGYIYLNGGDTTLFLGESSTAYSLPPQSDVYIEFDYRCNNAFTVGIQGPGGVGQSYAWLAIDPSTTWNKIYIRLTDILADNDPSVDYKIYFAMSQDPNNALSYLYLDNIKLLK